MGWVLSVALASVLADALTLVHQRLGPRQIAVAHSIGLPCIGAAAGAVVLGPRRGPWARRAVVHRAGIIRRHRLGVIDLLAPPSWQLPFGPFRRSSSASSTTTTTAAFRGGRVWFLVPRTLLPLARRDRRRPLGCRRAFLSSSGGSLGALGWRRHRGSGCGCGRCGCPWSCRWIWRRTALARLLDVDLEREQIAHKANGAAVGQGMRFALGQPNRFATQKERSASDEHLGSNASNRKASAQRIPVNPPFCGCTLIPGP